MENVDVSEPVESGIPSDIDPRTAISRFETGVIVDIAAGHVYTILLEALVQEDL